MKHEESIVGLLPPPGLVGGLRGRNPLLVVSSVTPGGFSHIVLLAFPFGICIRHCILFHLNYKIQTPFNFFSNNASLFPTPCVLMKVLLEINKLFD